MFPERGDCMFTKWEIFKECASDLYDQDLKEKNCIEILKQLKNEHENKGMQLSYS